MEIVHLNRSITQFSSEFDMQEQVDKYLKNIKFYKIDSEYRKTILKPIILREIHNGYVNRISDHVIYFSPKKVINCECKLTDINTVIAQAKDHLLWADYSYIIIPPDITYLTNKHLQEIIDNGIGLTYWFNNIGMFEFIHARKSKKVIKPIREDMNRYFESIKVEGEKDA